MHGLSGVEAWVCLWYASVGLPAARGDWLAHNRAGARDDCYTQRYEIEREMDAYLGYTLFAPFLGMWLACK